MTAIATEEIGHKSVVTDTTVGREPNKAGAGAGFAAFSADVACRAVKTIALASLFVIDGLVPCAGSAPHAGAEVRTDHISSTSSVAPRVNSWCPASRMIDI